MPYTGLFPHNNSGVTTAIIVSDKTFTGSLDNTGTIILGNPTAGTGILVENNSTINGEISNNGTIEVSGKGIIVAGTANTTDESNVVSGIVNGAAGIITTASGNGVTVEDESKFSGGVSNFGIVSAGGPSSIGLLVTAVATFAGGIDNAGTVDAAIGIYVFNDAHFSGGVTNAGPIDAKSNDVGIFRDTGFTGNITNKGALTSTTADAIAVSTVDFAAGGTFSGSIGNSGLISAGQTGIKINEVGLSRFSGGIGNSGRITAANGDGVVITDVAEDGSFVGSIVNTGNIQSFGIGLTLAHIGTSSFDSVVVVGHGHHAQTTTGGISNSGAITSTNAGGISITAVAVHGTFSGNIVNSGAISAKKNGLNIGTVGSSAFFGGISNSGAITSTSGLGINIQDEAQSGPADFTKGIVNSGKIVAKSTGIIIANLALSRFSGGITNSGAVTSAEGDAIEISNVAVSGTFTNNIVNTGALSANDTGLDIGNAGASDFSGSIANSGAVTSTSDVGVEINSNAGHGNFIGNIANSGAVSAKHTGVQIDSDAATNFSGNIANTGAVTSKSEVGIKISSDAGHTFTGNITNSGTVSAKTTGVQIEDDGEGKFSGNITNSGAITSKSNAGIKINDEASSNGTFTGNIVNTGEVSAKTTGVQIENDGDSKFSGDIVNTGVVTSKIFAGIKIEGIASDGAFTGSIANKGAVSAQETAVEIGGVGTSGFSGVISNSGAISAATAAGFSVQNVASAGKFSGSIDNTGAISAEVDGIEVDNVGTADFTGGITNAGAIAANSDGFFVQSVAADGTFTGNIVDTGPIAAKGDGMQVDALAGSGFFGSISNDGRIVSTSDAGIAVDGIAAGGKFSGSIVNAGSVSAVDTGMLVENIGLTFSGGITNSGVISAGLNDAGLLVDAIPHLVGDVVNAATGTIAGSGIAIEDTTIAGSVIDTGTILGTSTGINIGSDARINAGGTSIDITGPTLTGGVYNHGLIDGKVGVDVTSAHGVNVFDDGIIIGSGGTAVELKASGDDFTLGEGYVVSGAVVGTAGDALQLGGAGPASFNLAAVGTQYKGFTAFNVVGGTWTMSGASGGHWNVDGGEMIISSGTLSNSNVGSGGTMLISAGGTLETTSGGAAVIAGHVIDNGTILASGGIMEFDDATVTGGGTIEIGDGIIRIQGDGNEDVAFNNDASGGLQIADDHADQNAYGGTVTGLGNPANTDSTGYIDLTSVTFVSGGTITGSYDNTNHILTVTSGGTDVASITLEGLYATDNFHFSSGVGDTVEIIDPAVHSGGHHHDHVGHSANLGLFANYMANFGAEAHGNLLISSVGQIDPVPPLLVSPHR